MKPDRRRLLGFGSGRRSRVRANKRSNDAGAINSISAIDHGRRSEGKKDELHTAQERIAELEEIIEVVQYNTKQAYYDAEEIIKDRRIRG